MMWKLWLTYYLLYLNNMKTLKNIYYINNDIDPLIIKIIRDKLSSKCGRMFMKYNKREENKQRRNSVYVNSMVRKITVILLTTIVDILQRYFIPNTWRIWWRRREEWCAGNCRPPSTDSKSPSSRRVFFQSVALGIGTTFHPVYYNLMWSFLLDLLWGVTDVITTWRINLLPTK